MAVRAVVRVTALKQYGYDGKVTQVDVHMQPVADKEGVYKSYSAATPHGELMLAITNPEAFEQFKVGKAYLVDFTPAE